MSADELRRRAMVLRRRASQMENRARGMVTSSRRARGISDQMWAIINVVCEEYHVPRELLMSVDRSFRVARARHVTAYLLREHGRDAAGCKLSFPRIGAGLTRDHSTVIHGYRLISAQVKGSPVFAAKMAELRARAKQKMAESIAA